MTRSASWFALDGCPLRVASMHPSPPFYSLLAHQCQAVKNGTTHLKRPHIEDPRIRVSSRDAQEMCPWASLRASRGLLFVAPEISERARDGRSR